MMIARDGGYRCNYSGLDGYARTARLRRVSSLKTLIPTAVSAKLKRFWEWPLSSTAEQRTHNPLVGGSNPPGATLKSTTYRMSQLLILIDCGKFVAIVLKT